MSKSSKPTLTSTVSINGKTKASSVNRNGNISTNYNMSDWEKSVYDYAGNALKNDISKVNVLSPQVQQNLQSQVNAYTQKGIDSINSTYNPMINSTKNDIASRFGNLDNSSFLNKLSAIENSRAKANSILAQDILEKKDELIGNELQRRYDYLNFMNNIQSQITNNAMQYIQGVQSGVGSASATAKQNNSGLNLETYLKMASTALAFAI